jgi:hypothetical protein
MRNLYFYIIVLLIFAYLEKRKSYFIQELEKENKSVSTACYAAYTLLNLFIALIPFVNLLVLYFIIFEKPLIDKAIKGIIKSDSESPVENEVEKEIIDEKKQEEEIDELLEKLKVSKEKPKRKRKTKPASVALYEKVTSQELEVQNPEK